MRSNKIEYWFEILSDSMSEEGVISTPEQRYAIARQLEISHEMYSEYSGEQYIPNPLLAEIDKLKKKHSRELDDIDFQKKIYHDALAEKIGLYSDEVHRLGIYNGELNVSRT